MTDHKAANSSEAQFPDDVVDQHLENVLRASGSSLRHYSMPKSIKDMRDQMRIALMSARQSSAQQEAVSADAEQSIRSDEREKTYRKLADKWRKRGGETHTADFFAKWLEATADLSDSALARDHADELAGRESAAGAKNKRWPKPLNNIDDAETPEQAWEFWKEIVCNDDGTLNTEQLKLELSDFSMLLRYYSAILCEITGGMISKENTHPSAVISVFNDLQTLRDEESAAGVEELRKVLHAAETWISHYLPPRGRGDE